jgi:hypothetical protein
VKALSSGNEFELPDDEVALTAPCVLGDGCVHDAS